jgi:RimJ/RimL family protein N-acetyltransferase
MAIRSSPWGLVAVSTSSPPDREWPWTRAARAPYAPGVLIETERLVLRRLALADLDEFLALHRDPEVVRFVRGLNRAQAEERLRANEQEWAARSHGMLAVLDRASGCLLGRVGLKHWPQFQETEAGWLLRRDAWGHGYATEAGRACLDWGFAALPITYVTAMIHPENTRSIGVARRLGFEPVREDVLLGDPVVVHAWGGGRPARSRRSPER